MLNANIDAVDTDVFCQAKYSAGFVTKLLPSSLNCRRPAMGSGRPITLGVPLTLDGYLLLAPIPHG
jgi:hypothetical protein